MKLILLLIFISLFSPSPRPFLSILAAVSMAEAHPDFVVGVVCRQSVSTHPNIIHMTPGD